MTSLVIQELHAFDQARELLQRQILANAKNNVHLNKLLCMLTKILTCVIH